MRTVKVVFMLLALAIVPGNLMAQSGAGGGTPQPDKAFPPFKILGNLYYVGTDALASFLIVTPDGDILIDSTYERNVPLIKASAEKLGFKFTDIKILLTSHAHIDHVEGDALVKQLTGATVMMMDRDVPAAQAITPEGKPHPIDKILHHLDRVSLGGTTLIANLTPGHTEGDITWTMKIPDGGKIYDVVIPGAIAPNPGTHLADNTAYPYIIEDNWFFYKYLRILPCDVMLGSHTPFFHMQEKYAGMDKGKNPFIEGQQQCLADIADWEKLFQSRIDDDQKRIAAGKK